MTYATTKDVLSGKLFIADNTIYVGKRVEKTETIRCSNVSSSGTTRTVPGQIIACGFANGNEGSQVHHASRITSSGNSFTFKSTNSAYTVTVDVKVLYIADWGNRLWEKNLLNASYKTKLKIDNSLGDIASPSDVMLGCQFSDGENDYIGTRKISVVEYTHPTVTTSGVSGTAPGTIVFAGYASGPIQGFYASPISVSGNKYSLYCTNSAYQMSNVVVRIAYIE